MYFCGFPLDFKGCIIQSFWWFSAQLPALMSSLSVFPGIVSLISLVILSYDRYSTLTVYNKQGINYRKPLLAVGGTWLYSLFWTVPPLLGWSSYGIEGAGTSCSVSWTMRTAQSHAYIICLFTFCLGIPVLVMIYCYGRLLWAVKQVEKNHIFADMSVIFLCVSMAHRVWSEIISWEAAGKLSCHKGAGKLHKVG